MPTLRQKLKQHHGLMMILCCAVPLIVLFTAVYAFGVSRSYLYWTVLLLCPLMHFFMMRDMHGGKESAGSREGGKPKKECH